MVTKIYTNVIVFGLLITGLSVFLFETLEAVSSAALIFPIGTSLAGGMVTVVLVFGRRQYDWAGWIAPVSLNAFILLASSWVILIGSVWYGGEAFKQVLVKSTNPEETARNLLMTAMAPIVSSTIAVMSAFATRDGDSDAGGTTETGREEAEKEGLFKRS